MAELLKKLWMTTLNLESEPATDESFFDLGGNSFFAAQIAQDFEAETGIKIDASDFYENETIDALCALAESKQNGEGQEEAGEAQE